MAAHNQLGKAGEAMAVKFFTKKGYLIVCRNWRYGRHEIDIIATKDNKLHFIEVKTRSSSRYGYPEESVTAKKFASLKAAADAYLFQHPGYKWIQYDVLSITLHKNRPPEYFLLEDVFM